MSLPFKIFLFRYALYVRDNEYLEEIFDLEIHPNLTINRGGVFFGNNQKLCRSKIKAFAKTMGLMNNFTFDDQDNPNIQCEFFFLLLCIQMAVIEYVIARRYLVFERGWGQLLREGQLRAN